MGFGGRRGSKNNTPSSPSTSNISVSSSNNNTPTTPTTKLTPVISTTIKPKPKQELNLSEEQINQAFENVLIEMGVPENIRMKQLSTKTQQEKQRLLLHFKALDNLVQDEEEDSPFKILKTWELNDYDVATLGKIHEYLLYKPIQWVDQFIQNGGIRHLLQCLNSTNVLSRKVESEILAVSSEVDSAVTPNSDDLSTSPSSAHGIQLEITTNKISSEEIDKQSLCIEALKALLNTNIGIEEFLAEKDSMKNLVLILDSPDINTACAILQILSVMSSYGNQGFSLVVSALDHYRLVKREKTRFYDIIRRMKQTLDLQYSFFATLLFNTLIDKSPDEGTKSIFKKELRNLKISELITRLKKRCTEKSMLDSHDDSLQELIQDLAVQIEVLDDEVSSCPTEYLDNDLSNAVNVVKLMKQKLDESGEEGQLKDMIHDLLTELIIYNSNSIDKTQTEQQSSNNWSKLRLLVDASLEKSNEEEEIVKTEKEMQLADRIKTQDNQIKKLEEEQSKIIGTFEEELKAIADLIEKAVQQFNTVSEEHEKHLKELKDKDESDQKKIKENDEELHKKKEELTKINHDITTLHKEIEELKNKVFNKQANNEEMQRGRRDLENRKKHFQEEEDRIAKSITELKKKVDTVRETEKKKRSELEELKKNPPKVEVEGPPTTTTTTAPPVNPVPPTTTVPTPPPTNIPTPPGTGMIPTPPGMGTIPTPPGMGGIPMPPGSGIPTPPGMGIPTPPGTIPMPPGSGIPTPPGMGGIPTPPGMGGIPMPPGSGIPMPPGTGIPMPPGMTGVPMPPGFGRGVPMAPMGMMGRGANTGVPVLPTAVPKETTRNVHFDQINKNNVAKTIFVKKNIAQDTNTIIKDIDLDDLTAAFSTQKKDTGEKVEAPPKEKKKEVKSLLDAKRSYAVSLQLGSLRGVSYEQLRKAIVEIDESIVTGDNIGTVRQIAPEQEEIDTVMGYDGPEDELAEPDKFFRVMNGLTNLTGRLDAWTFKFRFPELSSKVRPDIENLTLACQEARESEKFLELLAVILTFGNFLNGQQKKKVSYGFKLKSLAKLADTKSSDGKMSLLQYIVQFISDKRPHLMNFETELGHITPATRVNISSLEDDINELKKGHELLVQQIEKAKNNPIEGDLFVTKMEEFEQKVQNAIQIMDTKFNEMKAEIDKLATAFDERKEDLQKEPDKFLQLIDQFIGLFKQANEKNEQLKKAIEKQKKAEEEKLKKEQAKQQIKASAAKQKLEQVKNQKLGLKSEGRGALDDKTKELKKTTSQKRGGVSRRGGDLDGSSSGIDTSALNSAFVKATKK
ncbi:hypothetical protein ABK040_007833 [Willaertia magna]